MSNEFKGGFETLEVWKEARAFRNKISQIIKMFPEEEKFLLRNQITRSVRSVSNNIAEGYGRYHYKENIQFCRTARGSLMETLDHIIIAADENYITKQWLEELRKDYETLHRLLNGYIAYLKQRHQNENK